MGFFGNISDWWKKSKLKSVLGSTGGLLEAAMPWGKAIGFLGGAYLTYDAYQKDRDKLAGIRSDAKLGQADAIEMTKYAAEDFRIDKGMIGERFDLKQGRNVTSYGTSTDKLTQAAGSTQMQVGEYNKMKDQVHDAYKWQTDVNQLSYDASIRSGQKQLRKDLEGYANQYHALSQYTGDRSHDFFKAYEGLLS